MSMANQEDEDMKMALRLSMQQNESPEPKRSKSKENSGDGGDAPPPEESPEVKSRRIQRDLMAAAAEKRMSAIRSVESVMDVKIRDSDDEGMGKGESSEKVDVESGISGIELSVVEANKLFVMIFGEGVCKNVLSQWCNQGIR